MYNVKKINFSRNLNINTNKFLGGDLKRDELKNRNYRVSLLNLVSVFLLGN